MHKSLPKIKKPPKNRASKFTLIAVKHFVVSKFLGFMKMIYWPRLILGAKIYRVPYTIYKENSMLICTNYSYFSVKIYIVASIRIASWRRF